MLALCSGGCASFIEGESSIPTPEALADAANSIFTGRSADEMVLRYGMPTARTTLRGSDALVWQANTSMQWSGPTRLSTVNGTVGNAARAPYYESVPYSATIATPSYETEQYQCQMVAFIDKAGVVQHVGFAGKMGACQVFKP